MPTVKSGIKTEKHAQQLILHASNFQNIIKNNFSSLEKLQIDSNRNISMRLKPSKEEIASRKSLSEAIKKFGYESGELNDGSFVVADKNYFHTVLIQPQKIEKGEYPIFAIGNAKGLESEKAAVSIQHDGILRIGKRDINSLSELAEVKGSLDFSLGIELKNVRVKLPSGQFKFLTQFLK